MYEFLSQAPAFDRSPKNGFRCVRYLAREKIPDRGFGPVDWTTRDYAKSKPVSDAIFELYTDQFSYDRLELNPVVEKRDESLPDMIREKVTFDAAYAKERVIALCSCPGKPRRLTKRSFSFRVRTLYGYRQATSSPMSG